jgi:hypothetical protein
MLASCASAGGTSGGGFTGSSDSCAAVSAAVHLSHARTAFIGTALPGPVVGGAVLESPARFRVVRYLKGSGPAVVTVRTAVAGNGNGTVSSEGGIQPQAGQRWQIYTTSLHTPYETSLCGGSCVMTGIGSDDGVNVPCGK